MNLSTASISPSTVESIRTLLAGLHARIPLKLWMVTTVDDDDWRVVFAHNKGYDVNEGQLMSWRESFCCRMMKGEGPQFAAHADECEAYVNAPIGRKIPIKAYIGVPLYDDANRFIGTMCGIDPEPDVVGIRAGEPLVRQTAALVGRLLSMEMQVAAQRTLARQWSDTAHRDALTGLLNRRGWDELLRTTALAHDGELLGVIVVDLDGLKQVNDTEGHPAGDALIQAAANALTLSMRGQDVVARLGGDEFGVLMRCGGAEAREMVAVVVTRIGRELAGAKVAACIGHGSVPPLANVDAAFRAADQMMLEAKSARSAKIRTR